MKISIDIGRCFFFRIGVKNIPIETDILIIGVSRVLDMEDVGVVENI